MKRVLACVLLIGLVIGLAALAAEPQAVGPAYSPRTDAEGWEVLLDGTDLAAWDVDPGAGAWEITAQGELHPAKGGGTLFTRQRYCDVALELDFRVAPNQKSNSGIFVRVHSVGDPVNTGMEIQVLDDAAYGVNWDAMNANGALYDLVHPTVSASRPAGEWNHARITLNDNLVIVELNDKEIVRADLNQWTKAGQNPDGTHNKFPYPIAALPREGFIGLQNYGGVPVWYRSIRLKSLSDRRPQFTGREPITAVLRPFP